MPTILPPSTNRSTDLDRFRSLGREVERMLSGVRRSLDEEIRTYPTPIPRCDAQFNHVYEQRVRLTLTLERVNSALAHGDAAEGLAGALSEFATAPAFSDRADEQDLKARVGAALKRR